MSRIRANKITDKLGTGSVELEKGAHLPVGMGITGAGNINLSGVITATTISATTFSGVDSTAIKDSGGNVKIQAQASGAVYTGIHTFGTNTNFTDIDVDGHTNLDNLSVSGVATVTGDLNVGGTLTYEDVTNIDSVGVVTAREGIFLPDNKVAHFGNVSGTGDLRIYHSGSHSYIQEEGTGSLYIDSNQFYLRQADSDTILLQTISNGEVRVNHNGNTKLTTTSSGVTVTGTVAATAYTGDGSALTGISVGISTEALVKTNG